MAASSDAHRHVRTGALSGARRRRARRRRRPQPGAPAVRRPLLHDGPVVPAVSGPRGRRRRRRRDRGRAAPLRIRGPTPHHRLRLQLRRLPPRRRRRPLPALGPLERGGLHLRRQSRHAPHPRAPAVDLFPRRAHLPPERPLREPARRTALARGGEVAAAGCDAARRCRRAVAARDRTRCAPGVAYLDWRYSRALSFVRYRLFRLVRGGPCGYVVLNEHPGSLVVAQADGPDPDTLAAGVLAAVAEVAGEGSRQPEVVLASCHAQMRRIYEGFGFRPARVERPFALGSAHGPVRLGRDTSSWLVNFDWTDNGLRPPFLDQDAARPEARERRRLAARWRRHAASPAS